MKARAKLEAYYIDNGEEVFKVSAERKMTREEFNKFFFKGEVDVEFKEVIK